MPFAPFGIAHRQPPGAAAACTSSSTPSRAPQGADPTRAADTGADAAAQRRARRRARPGHAEGPRLWQDQTGGPTDPQPGNIPGGPRDVLRSADFNDGTMQAFAVDSGTLDGRRRRAAGRGRVARRATRRRSSTSTTYLPIYFEIVGARSRPTKPTGGWKANAYVIFDYFSPTDFKFAGIDVSTNKFVMGHRDATGWDRRRADAVPGQAGHRLQHARRGERHDRDGDRRRRVGVHVHLRGPRRSTASPYGLNKGLVGVGSRQRRAALRQRRRPGAAAADHARRRPRLRRRRRQPASPAPARRGTGPSRAAATRPRRAAAPPRSSTARPRPGGSASAPTSS